MKTRKLLVLGLLPIMMACGGSEEAEGDAEGEEVQEETCTYSYDHESTFASWTAFKLTEKAGVDGSFNEIAITPGVESSENMLDIFVGATFNIDPNTLATQDDLRDRKLKNSFFGNLNNEGAISGTINTMDETTAQMTISMNGVDVEYDGDVKIEGEAVTITSTIDILDFEGQVAMDSIGVVCEAKHTGPDGENKLWPDVNIAVKTTLIKECK